MPALLTRQSILPDGPMTEATDLAKAVMEGMDEVLHSRIWIFFLSFLTVSRDERSEERLRTPVMTMFDGFAESCITNSSPRPRFAPVTTQVAIMRYVTLFQ